MFSKQEQKAIQEKIEQLRKIKEGTLEPQGLVNLITQRRVDWVTMHLAEMLSKYSSLSPEEQAYRIIFLEHMKISPKHSITERVSPTKIKIESHNFCPYLQACLQLSLDTRVVCREVGEPAIQKMIEVINPNLRFSRDYTHVRPYKDFCLEFIEILD